MFLVIAAVIFLMWLLGFSVFHAAGGLIHVLLILAAVMIIFHFLKKRNTV